MALTRKSLKAMGLTDEQVDSIVEMHTETVDGLKAERDSLKADAEKLPGVQKELDDLKAAGDGGYKEKYEKEHTDFEAYKAQQSDKESRAAKEAAARTYYESKGITGKALIIALRGSKEEIGALELENGRIKDASALDALISGDYAGLVTTTTTTGADTATPPANSGGAMTRADIYKKDDKGRYVLSTAQRQKAIAENHEQFGI